MNNQTELLKITWLQCIEQPGEWPTSGQCQGQRFRRNERGLDLGGGSDNGGRLTDSEHVHERNPLGRSDRQVGADW